MKTVYEFGSGKILEGAPSDNLSDEAEKNEWVNAYLDTDDSVWRYVRPEDVDMFISEYNENVVMVYLG